MWAGWGPTHILWPPTVIEPEGCLFHGPLSLLVSRLTASAAEDLVNAVKWSGRGPIGGERTYGSSGQPFWIDCGDQMTFRIGAVRGYNPDGSRFEGVGIRPDVEIAPTREDLYTGRDRVLEQVLADIPSER